MDTTEQTRLAQPVLPSRPASAWSDIAAESVPTFGRVLRLMAAILTFVAVFAFAARFEHPLQTPQAGPLGDFLGVSVPVAAALVAAFALYRPWRALLLVLLCAGLFTAFAVLAIQRAADVVLAAVAVTLGVDWVAVVLGTDRCGRRARRC